MYSLWIAKPIPSIYIDRRRTKRDGSKKMNANLRILFSSSLPILNGRTKPITYIILAKIRRRKCTFLPHTNGITGRPTGGSTLYSISIYVYMQLAHAPVRF